MAVTKIPAYKTDDGSIFECEMDAATYELRSRVDLMMKRTLDPEIEPADFVLANADELLEVLQTYKRAVPRAVVMARTAAAAAEGCENVYPLDRAEFIAPGTVGKEDEYR